MKQKKRLRAINEGPEFSHGLPDEDIAQVRKDIAQVRKFARGGMSKAAIRDLFKISKGQLKRILRGG